MDGWMDGWMDGRAGGWAGRLVGWRAEGQTCDFTSFPTVFQLYQDNGRVIMKGWLQWNTGYSRKDFGMARSVGQC